MPIAIADAVSQGEPIIMVEKVVSEHAILQYIEFELIETTRMLNMNPGLLLQKHQLPLVAKTLYDNFKNESLEDFSLAFKRGATGFYNPEGLFRIDGAVITQWMQKYLEEKYTHIESESQRSKAKYKKEETAVDYKAYLERKAKETDDTRQKEIAEKRKNVDYELYKLNNVRKCYIADDMEVYATSEEEANKAYKAHYGKLPESVSLKSRDEEQSTK